VSCGAIVPDPNDLKDDKDIKDQRDLSLVPLSSLRSLGLGRY